LIFVIDILILISACASAWFWWMASGRKLRRVTQTEKLDSHDLNRIIVTINRGQILNSRAALATAISAAFLAVRFLMTLLEPYF
jgi:TRAP-type C4-dicarboxylate transport system permease small subunit